jgi:hypothetical protein
LNLTKVILILQESFQYNIIKVKQLLMS